MRCTNWQLASLAAALLGGLTSPGAAADMPNAPPHVTVIDDALVGEMMLGRFDYIGSWQHVRAKGDGRSNGTSTRSTRLGDVAILRFSGTRVRLFGVRGPSGGRAGIALDEKSTGGPVDFYAPRIEPRSLIYESPVLAPGAHMISIIVWGMRNERGHYYYVNIDGAEIESPPERR